MATRHVQIVRPGGKKVSFNGAIVTRALSTVTVHVSNNSELAHISQSEYQVIYGGSITIPVTYESGYDYTCISTDVGEVTAAGIVLHGITENVNLTIITDFSPKTGYFQFTNTGNSSITMSVTSASPGEFWVNRENVGVFYANSTYSVSIPAGGVLKLKGFTSRNNNSADISTNTTGYLTLDRFSEDCTALYFTFYRMYSLCAVTSWKGAQNITYMGDAFCGCSNLTRLPDSWVGLGSLRTMIGTFNGSGLLALPSSWRGLSSLYQFQYVFNSSPISALPASWEGLENVTIMRGTFHSCRNIAALPESWRGLSSIRYFTHVFVNCTGITTGGSSDTDVLSHVCECSCAFEFLSNWTGNAYAVYQAFSQNTPDGQHNRTFYGNTSAIGYSSIPPEWK